MMDDKNRKRLVYASLVCAIILALITRPWEGRQRRPTAAVRPSTAATTGGTIENLAVEEPEPITFAVAWPRDPFGQTEKKPIRPAGATTKTREATAQWNLQGILTVDNRRVCLFDGRTYEIGSRIKGWEITNIGTDGVRLRHGAKTINLALPKAGI